MVFTPFTLFTPEWWCKRCKYSNIIFTLFTPFTQFTLGVGWSSLAGISMVFTPFTLFSPFTLHYGVKGVNSVNPLYLHYLHTRCKISGVNNQIVHINITNTEGGTIDHSNA